MCQEYIIKPQFNEHIRATRRLTAAKRRQEMLAKCDFTLPVDQEDIDWMNDPPVGGEMI